MASFHNWTGDELIDTQVPQFLNEDNAATQEKLDTKLGINDTAAAAIKDGAGNNIVDTYAKKTDIPNITVDAELSDTSTNPIQNKAVKTAIDTVKNNMTQGFQTVTASIPTKVSDLENDAGYLTQHQSLDDYAKKTDISGFVKTVNGTAPDTGGNVKLVTGDIVKALMQPNGYIKYSNGLIIQWGKITNTYTREDFISVTFPIAFKSTVYYLAGKMEYKEDVRFEYGRPKSISKTGCEIFYRSYGTMYWLSIGI